MAKFGNRSKKRLDTCHPDLIRLFEKVVEGFDNSILCGHRNEFDQNKAFDEKRSKLKFPKGKHNTIPSLAIDVAPYPIDWNDIKRFYFFGGYVKGVAKSMGIKIRWGGDWDSDTLVRDQSFNDLPHFELNE